MGRASGQPQLACTPSYMEPTRYDYSSTVNHIVIAGAMTILVYFTPTLVGSIIGIVLSLVIWTSPIWLLVIVIVLTRKPIDGDDQESHQP